MAKHFVGQKVRIDCPCSHNGYDGLTTTVIALNVDSTVNQYVGHAVALIDRRTGLPSVYMPHRLIPITNRNEVVTWESCAWSPHGVSA